jgi:hypothetical protein
VTQRQPELVVMEGTCRADDGRDGGDRQG